MKILLATYGGGHVVAVLPVWHELIRRGHEPLLFAMTTAKAVATREHVPNVGPADYVDHSDRDVKRWGERLAERHHSSGKGISYEESVAYLGVSFRDLAKDVGEEEAWRQYEDAGLWCFTPTYFLEEVLREERPEVVVATTSPRMERAALRAAYRLGLPSLCMVELFGIQEAPWLSRPDNGDFAAISRSGTGDYLAACGRHRSTLEMTGSPLFDQLADSELPMQGQRWRREMGVGSAQKLVFWAEQPEPNDPELPRRVRAHLSEVCRRNGWKLVVRLHPSSSDPAREKIDSDVLLSRGEEPLKHVIHAADASVTLTSTVGMEVLLSDKPLLVPRLSANTWMAPYSEDDGALTVDTLEAVESGLTTLLSGGTEAGRLALRRQALPAPGGAAARICDLIESEKLRRRLLPYGSDRS